MKQVNKKFSWIFVSLFLLATFNFVDVFADEIISEDKTATEDKISSQVYQSLEENDKVKVIIKFGNSEKSSVRKSSAVGTMSSVENIITPIHTFENSFSAEISEEDLENLKNTSGIESIVLDQPVHAFLQQSVPLINANLTWSINYLGKNITGLGETVCVVDTGINFSNPDLTGRNKSCVIDCYAKTCVENCSISDDNGHGTHVAGIVGANGSLKGVAIETGLIGVKVLDASGGGYGSYVQAGMQWCVNNAATYNISVISLSLGDCANWVNYCTNGDNSGYITQINNAVAKNISVVISSGNGQSASCPTTTSLGVSAPACAQNATAVGATNDLDSIASFTQRWGLFQLMAPGVSIYSTSSAGAVYETMQGTSMAAPHVSGVIALLQQYSRLQNNRSLTTNEIKIILNNSGEIVPDTSGVTSNNYSRIDAYSAILSIDSSAPQVYLTSPNNNVVQMNPNITLNCSANDVKMSNLTFYLWNSTSLIYNSTKYSNDTSMSSSVNITDLSYDTYLWNCLGVDSKNYSAFSSTNNSFRIGLGEVYLEEPETEYYTNQNLTFNCSGQTEPSRNLTNITFYLWNSTSLIYNSTSQVSGIMNSSLFNYNFSSSGNYSWNCVITTNVGEIVEGNSNYSVMYSIAVPEVSGVSSSTTTSSGTITWTTNSLTNSTINYGTSSSFGNSLSSAVYSSSHSQTISSLSSGTTYYYNLTNCDIYGNCAVNGTYSFTTGTESSSGGSSGGSSSDSSEESSATETTKTPSVKNESQPTINQTENELVETEQLIDEFNPGENKTDSSNERGLSNKAILNIVLLSVIGIVLLGIFIGFAWKEIKSIKNEKTKTQS